MVAPEEEAAAEAIVAGLVHPCSNLSVPSFAPHVVQNSVPSFFSAMECGAAGADICRQQTSASELRGEENRHTVEKKERKGHTTEYRDGE